METQLHMWQRMAAGLSAYSMGALACSPADVVKCRMQLAQDAVKTAHPAIWPTARRLLRTEGAGSFFTGLGPVLLMAPGVAVQFAIVDVLRARMPLWVAVLAGGSVDCLINTPLERIKTQLRSGEASTATALLCRTWQASGICGLWAGLGITLARDLPFIALKWLSYERMRPFCASLVDSSEVASLLAGASAGAVAVTVVTPIDVVKTHVQTTHGKEVSVRKICQKLMAEGGAPAFFRGLGPRLLRSPVHAAVSFATFEKAKEILLAWSESRSRIALGSELEIC